MCNFHNDLFPGDVVLKRYGFYSIRGRTITAAGKKECPQIQTIDGHEIAIRENDGCQRSN